jgi:hypothetical protein
MILVGLTGAIGSGKTTLARMLDDMAASSAHYETWMIIAEVANKLRGTKDIHPSPDDPAAITEWLQAIPAIVKAVTHAELDPEHTIVSIEKLAAHPEHYAKLLEYLITVQSMPQLAHIDINEGNKELFRPILQWLGGFLVYAAGPGIWYDEIVRRIKAQPSLGLVTVGGVRYPGDAERIVGAGGKILRVERPDIGTKDHLDLTERERSMIQADSVILNDGGLDELNRCASDIYKDLVASTLKSEYSATLTDRK